MAKSKDAMSHACSTIKVQSSLKPLQQASTFLVNAELSSGKLRCALLPSVHDRAAGYFFANFVYSDAPVTSDFGDYVKRRYSPGPAEDVLSLAMKALGLAGIANISNVSTDVTEARKGYGRALTVMNKALSNPQSAASDATLLAVWFLAMIEVGSPSNAWYNSG